MQNFSGSFSGRAIWQTMISLEDVPNHEMHLATIAGLQKSNDANWKDSRITYWGGGRPGHVRSSESQGIPRERL